jgi:hypothetical protein
MRSAERLGFWAAATCAAAAAGYAAVQLLQLAGVVGFPVADALIYAVSLAIAPPFLLAMAALDHLAGPDARLWTRLAVTYVALMYVTQLGSVLPAQAAGRADVALTVYPQSLFWTIDALGYLAMGAAALFAGLGLPRTGPGRWARRLLLAHAGVTPLIAAVYFYPHFSAALLMLGSPWAVTAPAAMTALAGYFRTRAARPAA